MSWSSWPPVPHTSVERPAGPPPPQACSTCSRTLKQMWQDVPTPRSHSLSPDKQAWGANEAPDTGCSEPLFHLPQTISLTWGLSWGHSSQRCHKAARQPARSPDRRKQGAREAQTVAQGHSGPGAQTRQADTLWGCDCTHRLSQGHAQREEILKTEAGVGKVPHATLFSTPFCPQRGTFVPQVPVLEVETVLPKELRPTLVSRDPGSHLPESPTTCEMWVGLGTGWCWGPFQVEGSCTPGS